MVMSGIVTMVTFYNSLNIDARCLVHNGIDEILVGDLQHIGTLLPRITEFNKL